MFLIEIVFLFSLIVIAYTYILYPVFISILSKIYFQPILKASYTPKVTLLIVVHNGEELIAKKLDNCLSLDYPEDCLRILVVSDGSTDTTDNIVKQYSTKNVTLLSFSERRGKAACLNDAFNSIDDEYVILNDVRQKLDKSAALELMNNFSDENIGAVSGELLFFNEGENAYSEGIGAYWRYEKIIRNAEGKVDSVAGVTGAIYALRKNCFIPIPAGLILDDVLIPMNAVMNGKRVIFDPTARAYDVPSNDPEKERRRKIRTTAGNWQLLSTVPDLMNPQKNRIWLQFISHKVLRLLSPIFLLIFFVSNTLLVFNSGNYLVIFLLQGLLYFMALSGIYSKACGKISLVKIAVAFCSLNWYAMLGGFEYYKNKNAHLW
jgi:cellulose synthase/poly-beta-1,6-N-acetylglucosamine synthase-like glycosyltransferase